MEILNETFKEKPKNSWRYVDSNKYQVKNFISFYFLINYYYNINLNNNINFFFILKNKVSCHNFFFYLFNYCIRRRRSSLHGRFRKKKTGIWNMWRM
jgi:hypothetical protein